MEKLVLTSLLFSLSVALTGCGDKDVANETDKQTQSTAEEKKAEPVETSAEAPVDVAPTETKNFFSDAEGLQKAEDSLKALPQFEGKPLNVFQDVHFYDDGDGTGRIMLEVQDPNIKDNIDHYEYDTASQTWSEPQPVQISGDGDLSANMTPLADIKFADIANVVVPIWQEKAAESQVETENNLPEHISMTLWVPGQDRFWQSSMESPRARYVLRVNLDGSLNKFEKS